MDVSFDLFGTLVRADRPAEPWSAVEKQLRERGVALPQDWEEAYRESHLDTEPGRECSLRAHTVAALEDRDVAVDPDVVGEALLRAFDGPVEVRPGAVATLEAASERGAVGLLSNCSLPGLVDRTLSRADLPPVFDAVVTSVGCGWRKPHDQAFAAVATELDTRPADLVHVGDDPRTDGGGRTCGVRTVLIDEVPLTEVPQWLEDRECG